MPSTDAYLNPDYVAEGEFIEDEWGNAVVNRVVRRYPTWAAWNGENPAPGDGETYAIGDQLFVVTGGRMRQVSSSITGPAAIYGNNVAADGATSQLIGTLAMSTVPWDMMYVVIWSGAGSGQDAAGGVTPSIRNDANNATVYGIGPDVPFVVGGGPSWTCQAKITVPSNTTLTVAFHVLINGALANLNITGMATAIGIPA